MGRYTHRRLLLLIPILIGITFLSFSMMWLAGSNAVTEMYANKGAVSQEDIDLKRAGFSRVLCLPAPSAPQRYGANMMWEVVLAIHDLVR